MRRRPLVLATSLTLALALGACGKPAAPIGVPTAEAASAAPTIGIDLAGIDKAVRPGDDFEAHANGAWAAAATIPDDRSSASSFLVAIEKAEQRQRELVQELVAGKHAAGSDEARIADYYTAFMDEAGIEARGLAPLQPELDAIAAIADKSALAAKLGADLRADVDPLNATDLATDRLFGLFVAQGLGDPSKNIGYLMQGGLGMPDRDYYLSADPDMAAVRTAYQAYIAALFNRTGVPADEARAKAKSVYALEERIAKAHASINDTQDVHKANNVWALADFARKAPGLDWDAYFEAAGLDAQPVLDAWQPGAITGLSKLVASEPLDAWKDWLAFHALDRAAPLLPKAYADLAFAFHGTTLTGTPSQRARDKRALDAVGSDLGDAVGKLYVAKFFPASSKARIEQLVSNLLAVFPERIDRLDWMSAETKAKAKAKAAAMRVGVGYPEAWRDYSALDIRADDALGNHQRAELAEYHHQRAKLGTTPDRMEWWMTPQTVNAVQLPLQNAMNFPAAILEPPFFDPSADDAFNYGAIGAVIGHEITHGFDDMGAEFDVEGRLRNWWTPEDAAHFKAAGKRLVAQFDAYEALPGLFLKGELELGENIADLAGLAVALDAYHKSLGGKEAPVIDGLTGDQRFFLAYAQAWRSKIRDAALRARVVGDVHAPARFRAQTVRNLDAWYTAFDVQEGSKLYLAPEQRIKVW